MPNFHSRLKQARLGQSLSQTDLAAIAGVTQPTIANWESGSHIPRQAALSRLATILNVENGWLLLGGENQKAQRPIEYLSIPIQHVPIYAWKEDWDDLMNGAIMGYVPYASGANSLIAVSVPDTKASVRMLHIFDTSKAATQSGESPVQTSEDNGLDKIPAHLCATITMYS